MGIERQQSNEGRSFITKSSIKLRARGKMFSDEIRHVQNGMAVDGKIFSDMQGLSIVNSMHLLLPAS